MRELIKAAAALAVIWAGTHYMVKRAIGAEVAWPQEIVESHQFEGGPAGVTAFELPPDCVVEPGFGNLK